MINLRTPIFWAYIVLLVYALFQGAVVLVFSPNSGITKVLFGILEFLCFVVTIVFVVMWIRHPIPSNHIILTFGPILIGLVGLVQASLGSLSLLSLLDALPLKVDSIWRMYMNISGAIMLPVGILVSIFSALQLISNRKSK